MRIGIDARTILDPANGEQAGVGHYTFYLIKNLIRIDKDNKYVLFFNRNFKETAKFEAKNTEIKHFPARGFMKWLPFAYSHMVVARVLAEERLDVFHSPASTIPLRYNRPSVVTIHDLAIYINQSWFPWQGFSTKITVPKSLKKARKIIAVSESTKKDIIKILKVPSEKIEVVYNGVRPIRKVREEDVKGKFGISEDFILFIGTIEPRKNLIGLIKALNSLRGSEAFKKHQLVIVGKKGWFFDDVYQTVRDLGLTKKVVFTGYVSSDDKVRLLRGARLFIFPSFYEGFGLSILEAMREGTPVITSNVSAMPEVAGSAAELIDPSRPDSIAAAIKKVISDKILRSEMIRKGKAQEEMFSWDKCVRETLRVYKTINKKYEKN